MRFSSTEDLARELVRLRLVTDESVIDAQARFQVTSDPDSLLKALEQQHTLTSYQASKLRSGDNGPLILGKCKLMYQNASGSFARVYRGCDIDSGQMLGVKVLRQRHVSDPASVGHFHREAELCMRLQHKNIVPIYDVGTQDDHHYFTMEFVEGGNLRDFINIRGKVATHELLRCGCDMAEGLEYALTQGMTHRDFKPSNILMSSRGVAKLVDFGLAGDESAGDDDSVQAVEYATLEKGTGAPRNDPRSDLFFLGAVMFELATGSPAWNSSRRREDRKQFSRYQGVRQVRRVDPAVPTQAADIIDRLLRVNPNERYQTATEVVADLKAALVKFDEKAAKKTVGESPRLSTVMCVEHRIKQQDLLREYLSKHGYRVLMLSTWERALNRLRNSPPDCLLIIGEALEGDSQPIYDEALRWSQLQGVACVLVHSTKEFEAQSNLHASARSLLQPVTLRDVRTAIDETLKAYLNRS
jgi:eukaryotic-like serine/threonine-protein kinase